MSQHEDSSQSQPPLLTATIVLALAISVAGIYFVAKSGYIAPITEASFAFEPIVVDEDRLKHERLELYGAVALESEPEKVAELQGAAAEANRLQWGASTPTIRKARIRLEYAAQDVNAKLGLNGFMKVGVPIFEGCQSGLAEIQEALKAGKVTMESLAKEAPAKHSSTYVENCGNVMPWLMELKLVGDDGQWRDPKLGPKILDLFSRYRWAHTMRLRSPEWAQLTPYERELLTRFRVEDRDAFPVSRRQLSIGEARRVVPDYPADIAAGNIAVERKDWVAAERFYAKACEANPTDRQLTARCEYLRKRAAAPGGDTKPPAHPAH